MVPLLDDPFDDELRVVPLPDDPLDDELRALPLPDDPFDDELFLAAFSSINKRLRRFTACFSVHRSFDTYILPSLPTKKCT